MILLIFHWHFGEIFSIFVPYRGTAIHVIGIHCPTGYFKDLHNPATGTVLGVSYDLNEEFRATLRIKGRSCRFVQAGTPQLWPEPLHCLQKLLYWGPKKGAGVTSQV